MAVLYTVSTLHIAALTEHCHNLNIQFDILFTVYHYVSQHNKLNTLSLSQTLYCVVILYMFQASSVHLQEALH
jgi:hypothetical protein